MASSSTRARISPAGPRPAAHDRARTAPVAARLRSGRAEGDLLYNLVVLWSELPTPRCLRPADTLDGKWNNSTIVEQLNDLIRSFSSRARREAVLRSHSPSERHLEISDNGQAQP